LRRPPDAQVQDNGGGHEIPIRLLRGE